MRDFDRVSYAFRPYASHSLKAVNCTFPAASSNFMWLGGTVCSPFGMNRDAHCTAASLTCRPASYGCPTSAPLTNSSVSRKCNVQNP